jgi:hypothetical protein
VDNENEILDQLKQLNGTAEKMLVIMSKMPGKAMQILTVAAAVAAVLGLTGTIDQIIVWIRRML